MVSSRSSGLIDNNDIIVGSESNNRHENDQSEASFIPVDKHNRLSPTPSCKYEASTNPTATPTDIVELRINYDKDAATQSSFVSEETRGNRGTIEKSQENQHRRSKEFSNISESGSSSLPIANYTPHFLADNSISNSSNFESRASSNIIDNEIVSDGEREHVEAAGPSNEYATETEENYEGFGYVRTATEDGADLGLDVEVNETPDGSNSAPSSTGPNSLSLVKSTSPSLTIGRHSWSRTSLRRTPPCTSGRQRQLGSNALASQLYRSGSFNSSGRGSTCDATDDMYSDVSLEDDVIDLNNRVRMIQEQMHVLTDSHSIGEERYARVKQENATLHARILMLEEAAKDAEARAEEKLETEQRRHREWACRLEREKQLQLENYSIKMQTIELESNTLRDQITRLREQLDNARDDRSRLENVIQELRRELAEVREAERQALLRANEARVVLDAAKEELTVRGDERLRLDELLQEVQRLSDRNKTLEESRDELQAAVALYAGRELFMTNMSRSGYDTPNATTVDGNGAGRPSIPTSDGSVCSLAVELSADVTRDRNSMSIATKKPLTMSEMRQALKEQQEVNSQLRSYIDGILLNIVENYPQLLEVKQQ